MASFLFLTWDGGGASAPLTAIAEELRDRGHDVRVLGHAVQAARFERAGIPFAAYRRAGRFVVGSSPRRLLALTLNRDAARDVADELDARPVDLVVGDPILLSTLRALHRRGQRYALLEHTMDGLLRMRLRRLGGVFRPLGYRVPALLDDAVAVIVASAAELDADHGPGAVHVGTVARAVAARADDPTVLLSLSTFRFPRLLATWQRLLDALGELPVRVIATTGPSLDPSELRVPANAEMHGWARHEELMPRVSAVICHGGHDTTLAALAHGLPVLVVPLDPASDQPGIGRAVQRAGVGLSLPGSSSETRIRSAVQRLLADADLRRRASELGTRMRVQDGRSLAADELERAAGMPSSIPLEAS